jgi:hypothetical protein
MTTRWARVVRGVLAAVFATFVAAWFHSAAGGSPPSWLAVTVTLAGAIPAAVFLTGSTLSWIRLSLTVAASQFLLHITLGMSSQPFRQGPLAAAHHGSTAIADPAAVLNLAGVATHDILGHNGAMWPAHLLAAVVTILAVGHGEAAFWAVLALAGLSIAIALASAPTFAPRPYPQRSGGNPRARIPRSLAPLSSMRLRGPPVSVA